MYNHFFFFRKDIILLIKTQKQVRDIVPNYNNETYTNCFLSLLSLPNLLTL